MIIRSIIIIEKYNMITIDQLKIKIEKKSRLLGIDMGAKRIGISICDDKRLVATPLETIVFKSLDVLIGVTPHLEKKLITSSINKPASVYFYVLRNCPWSKRALKLLDSLHVKYNIHMISNDEEINLVNLHLYSPPLKDFSIYGG